MHRVHRRAQVVIVVIVVVACVMGIVMANTPAKNPIDFFGAHMPGSLSRLVGQRVVVANKVSADSQAAFVTVTVNAQGTLASPIVVPYPGQSVDTMTRRFQLMFGPPHVQTSTKDVSLPDKVIIVYDASTRKTTKVNIPRRWSTTPDYLSVPLGTPVHLNPTTQPKGLTLKTGNNSVVTNVTLT